MACKHQKELGDLSWLDMFHDLGYKNIVELYKDTCKIYEGVPPVEPAKDPAFMKMANKVYHEKYAPKVEEPKDKIMTWDEMCKSGLSEDKLADIFNKATDIQMEYASKGSFISFEAAANKVYKDEFKPKLGEKEGEMEEMPKLKPKSICVLCGVPLCEVCGTCETNDCQLFGKRATSKAELIAFKHLLAGTQKARGFVALTDAKYLRTPSPFVVLSEPEEVDEAVKVMGGKIFARPCPTRPRHGFVESRIVLGSTLSEKGEAVRAILAEAKKADPKAELLLCPPIEAGFNLVITPTRMAVGRGHDGATSGKDSITIPLMDVPWGDMPMDILNRSAINPDEDPYIECVVKPYVFAHNGQTAADGSDTFFTQIRAGVKIPGSVGRDYIPFDLKVEHVLEASGDLLEWEEQTKTIKPGTVVCHVGGTLTSHYGVHCLCNHVPVMTSRKPEIGDYLRASSKPPMPDPNAVIRGLGAGALFPLTKGTAGHAIVALATVLHNAGAMGGEDGFWLGVASSFMIRTGMAASHGEARHAMESFTSGKSRDAIYKTALKDFLGSRMTLGMAQWQFLNHKWSSSFGGKAWAKCTDAVMRLDFEARAVMAERTPERAQRLVSALNNAVNQAHNGGWWMNKFINKQAFDACARQNLRTLALSGAMYLEVDGFCKENGARIDKLVRIWEDCGDIDVVKCVEVDKVSKLGKAIKEAGMEGMEFTDGIKTYDYIKLKTNSGDDDDDEDEDSPFDSKPEKIDYNLNGTKSIMDEAEFGKLNAVQGKIATEKTMTPYIHLQLKTEKSGMYYWSMDIKPVEPLTVDQMEKFQGKSESWLPGSPSHEYNPFTIEHVGGGKYKFKHEPTGIEIVYSFS